MEEMSAEETLQKSINDLTKGLNPDQKDRTLHQAAKILDAVRLLAASGAGPVPVSSAGTSSGTPLICPRCGNQIKITLSP